MRQGELISGALLLLGATCPETVQAARGVHPDMGRVTKRTPLFTASGQNKLNHLAKYGNIQNSGTQGGKQINEDSWMPDLEVYNPFKEKMTTLSKQKKQTPIDDQINQTRID